MDKHKLCYISKSIVEGKSDIKLFYRTEIEDDKHSGWIFLDNEEEEDSEMATCDVAWITEYNPTVVVHLDKPIGSILKVQENTHRIYEVTPRKLETLNQETFATNQGEIKIDKWWWYKNFPSHVYEDNQVFINSAKIFAGLLSITLPLVIFAGLSWIVGLVLVSIPLIVCFSKYKNWKEYWTFMEERFKYGDANPAIVIGIEPYIFVATSTDLKKGSSLDFPIVKVSQYTELPLFNNEKLEIGTRLATVALYQEYKEANIPFWIDFYPVPVNYATQDEAAIGKLLGSFLGKEWQELERRIKSIPQPYQKGIYRIDVETTGWNKYPIEQVQKWSDIFH